MQPRPFGDELAAALTQLAGEVEAAKQSGESDLSFFWRIQADNKDLRQKLAASERECVRLGHYANTLNDDLAAAKLDADALAGALEHIVGLGEGPYNFQIRMVDAANKALRAHRATGGAGEKK